MYEDAEADIMATQRNSASQSTNARKDRAVAEFELFMQQVFAQRGRTMATCTPLDVLTFISKVGIQSSISRTRQTQVPNHNKTPKRHNALRFTRGRRLGHLAPGVSVGRLWPKPPAHPRGGGSPLSRAGSRAIRHIRHRDRLAGAKAGTRRSSR